MTLLEKARARLKGLLDAIKEIESKETLTAEDLTALNEKTAEAEAVEKEIDSLVKAQGIRARASQAADAPAGGAEDGKTTPATVEQKMEPDQQVSLVAAATLKSRATGQPVLKVLADSGYNLLAKTISDHAKTKTVDTSVAEVFLPDVVSTPYIDLLRPNTTFFQGGPERRYFTHGKYKVPRIATGSSAAYVGEADRKPLTNPTFDFVSMAAKKLAAIVPITQEARDWPMVNIDTIIRNDLRKKFAIATDFHAYFGTGAGDSPVGILNISGVAAYDASNYSVDNTKPTLVEVDALAAALILSLTTRNVFQNPKWAWVMSYRTRQFLADMRVGDANTGVYAYPEIRSLMNPTWKGIRVLVSNQVADNLGDEGDASTIGLVDFSEVIYAEEGGMVVKTSDQASLYDGVNTIHLWQQNMYGILTEVQHDWTLEHVEAVAKATNVRWGAGDGSPA